MILLPDVSSSWNTILLWGFIGYVMGSIPFGLLLAQIMGLRDLRSIGSGNIGATNVLRTGSRLAASLTLCLDFAKGAIVSFLALGFVDDATAQSAGLGAIFGHCYPVWLFFKGGKGVSTSLGVLCVLDLRVGIACAMTWTAIIALIRISSVSGLAAVSTSLLWSFIFGQPSQIAFCLVVSLVVFCRHHENLKRLSFGTEPKIGQK